MVPLAPRYDPRIVAAVAALDEPGESMAETCRRVGAYAEVLGLPRPSYSHLRRFVREERARREAERARREEIRKILGEVYVDLATGRRVVDAYDVADRLRRAGT